jgi:AraC-like DNA-binding protein
MTTTVSEAATPGRTEFTATDSDRVIDYLNQAYRTNLRVTGVRSGTLFRHCRADAGSFAIDDLQLPLHLGVRQTPLESLVILDLEAGRFERECGGVTEQFASGDVFIDADPTLPAALRMFDVRAQTVMLDLAVLAQVAATAPARAPGPIRFTGYQPVSPAAAEHWRHTVSYLREVLVNTEASAQPLIRGNAARLLAATALTTFPNTAVTDPSAQDRADATNVTARRAVAFIEQHAHADISLVDIATAGHVSIRALQLAFRRHLDTTPMTYLRTVRMDRVHRELLAAEPGHGVTVTEIASRWGFHNHSRFANRYRHNYGVYPHHTLHIDGVLQPPATAATRLHLSEPPRVS